MTIDTFKEYEDFCPTKNRMTQVSDNGIPRQTVFEEKKVTFSVISGVTRKWHPIVSIPVLETKPTDELGV